ncbi:MAG: hypothetical protein M3R27_04020 [Bacteroidota bacterium]|nr:hypothetical protein [Bacteroidota bacterium]
MKSANKAVIICIVALSVLYAANVQWGRSNWINIIEADGRGYYAYLPAVFVYQDLNFGFYDEQENKYPGHEYDYRVAQNDRIANKYFIGTAIAMSPAFLIAHAVAGLSDASADGFSRVYAIAINIAGILYLFLGLFYLRKLLRLFGFIETRISFVLVVLTFGTSLFYYAAIEPAMSHVYSFSFITAFLYFLKSFFIVPGNRSFIIMSVLFGMIFLIRPVNVLILLFIPFFAGNLQTFKNGMFFLMKERFQSAFGIFLFFCICSIQPIVYWMQTGSFWIDSYGEEKFNWFDPHPIDFLFSYKKGLFVYTPIAFLSLLGFIQLYRKNMFKLISLTLGLIILLYVFSSWWNWWYGGSFGSRVCVEFYALTGILLCYSFDTLKQIWLRRAFAGLMIVLMFVCQVQVYQYRYFYIHWEKMDKERFWNVFMRLDLIRNHQNPNSDLLD